MPNMQGKICLVTGGNNGIGRAAALLLALQGAQVIIASRNRDRNAQAVADIRARTGNDAISAIEADLSTRAGVAHLAEAVRARTDRLDVLMNNAGTMQGRRVLTADGQEMNYALHVVTPVLLATTLRDLLAASDWRRVVNISSLVHYMAWLDFGNLQGERWYNGTFAYCQSKLVLTMLTGEMARQFASDGITANSAHPGAVSSNLADDGPLFFRLTLGLGKPLLTPPIVGAQTQVMLATSPALAGATGGYYMWKRRFPPSPLATDPATARRLWDHVLAGG